MGDGELLVLSPDDISGLLDLPSTVERVESELRAVGRAGPSTSFRQHVGVLGGAFHVVCGGSGLPEAELLAVKINRRFDNAADGHPGGFVALVDMRTGRPLAVMDSAEITRIRTAAQVAVAVRLLARPDADTLLVVGSGQLTTRVVEGVQFARPLRRVDVWSRTAGRAEQAAEQVSTQLGLPAAAVTDLSAASKRADVIVTITSSRTPLLATGDVSPGSVICALGSDGPGKQELDAHLVASAGVVVDSLEQAVAHGELGHAIRQGLMTIQDVRDELADIVSGRRPGRQTADELVIFDSTGTAQQDVAAAALVLERATDSRRGVRVPFAAAYRSTTERGR